MIEKGKRFYKFFFFLLPFHSCWVIVVRVCVCTLTEFVQSNEWTYWLIEIVSSFIVLSEKTQHCIFLPNFLTFLDLPPSPSSNLINWCQMFLLDTFSLMLLIKSFQNPSSIFLMQKQHKLKHFLHVPKGLTTNLLDFVRVTSDDLHDLLTFKLSVISAKQKLTSTNVAEFIDVRWLTFHDLW